MSDARAGGEQHAPGENRDEQRHRQMGLEEDQCDHGNENDDEGQHAALKVAKLIALLRREHGTPDDDRELRQLGWLQRQHTKIHPAAGAVDRRSDRVREWQQRHEQQHTGDAEERPRPAAPAMVIHPRESDREQTANRRPDRLAQREAGADLAAGRRHETGSAVDGREAEDDEHRRDDGE